MQSDISRLYERFLFLQFIEDKKIQERLEPLLIEKHNLRNFGKCVRELNQNRYFKNLIRNDVSADIEIEKFEDIEIQILKNQWKEQKKILKKIKLISEGNQQFVFEVPSDIKVVQFKSFVLNQTKKPFFFDFKIDHEKKVEELFQKSVDQTLNISFNQNILNLQIYDTFEQNHLIIKGLSKDSTIKEILQKIAKMLVASGKNFKIPEKDILNQLWLRKKKSCEILDPRLSLQDLGICRYYDDLMFSFPGSHKNGFQYVDLQFENSLFRFQINLDQILYDDLLQIVKQEPTFNKIEKFLLIDLKKKALNQQQVIKAKETLIIVLKSQQEQYLSGAESFIDDKMDGADIFDLIPDMIQVNFKVPQMKKDFTFNIRKNEKVLKVIQQISYEIDKQPQYIQLRCEQSQKVLLENLSLSSQSIAQGDKISIIVEIVEKIMLNIFNKIDVWFTYEKQTTLGDMIQKLPQEYFQDIDQQINVFEDVKINKLIVTFNDNIITQDKVISQNFQCGDRLVVQYKLNFNRGDEWITNSNISYLEMMYYISQGKYNIEEQNFNLTQGTLVKQEMKTLLKNGGTNAKKKIDDLFQDEIYEQSIDFFKSLIKIYTEEQCFEYIGSIFNNGNYQLLNNYLNSMINLQNQHGQQLQYKGIQSLFRGVENGKINLDDYKINHIHYWPKPTSTSKNLGIAKRFGSNSWQSKKYVIFEILVSKENDPITNIEIKNDMTFCPGEEEVLLMPQFQFIVLEKYVQNQITHIKIAELPFQNLLKPRKIYLSRVIWIDDNVDSAENKFYREIFQGGFQDVELVLSKTIEGGIQEINNTVKSVVITTGSIGQVLLPKIHSFGNLMGVLIFCQNLQKHKAWASQYEKVKGVTEDIVEAMMVSQEVLSKSLNNDYILQKKQ